MVAKKILIWKYESDPRGNATPVTENSGQRILDESHCKIHGQEIRNTLSYSFPSVARTW